jgi:uncharacterized protein (DUF58 family)
MSAAPSTAAATTTLSPSRDERLVPYCLVAFGGLSGALLAGQPALAALAAPFALALALGLRRQGSVEVTARVTLDADQVLEGDLVIGSIELEWDPALDAHALVHRLQGFVPGDPGPLSWSLPSGSGRAEIPIQLQAVQWGRHTTGEVWLRLTSPRSLVSWTGRVVSGPAMRVLPARERLTRLLDPPESRAVLGLHRSRRLGDGYDFAELRPYTFGDRLRDLNWGATARYRRPFVNRHHPERSGDIVIVIDAFADGSASSTEALARVARAAWAIASIHLQASDRVGLAALGSGTMWLPPAGGQLAQYRLLETLLVIGGNVASSTVHGTRGWVAVPPSALIVALTPLHDARIIGALLAWRARGRSVAVIQIDTDDLLGEPQSTAESLARRIWNIEIDHRRRELSELGLPVVTFGGDGPLAPVISALRRVRRGPVVRRGP